MYLRRVPFLVLFLLYKIPDRLLSRLKSNLLGWALGVDKLSVHHSARIEGHSSIKLSKGFKCGKGLWLQAIQSYNNCIHSPSLVIGSRFACSDNVHITSICSLTIGDDVLVGSHVLITDHNHGRYSDNDSMSSPSQPPISRILWGKSVEIGDRVFLGDCVRILPGAKIGDGVIVACNSVVNSIIPPNTICAGIPAKPIKFYSDEAGWIHCLHPPRN